MFAPSRRLAVLTRTPPPHHVCSIKKVLEVKVRREATEAQERLDAEAQYKEREAASGRLTSSGAGAGAGAPAGASLLDDADDDDVIF